jgi:chemotaxis protein CheD
MEHMARMGEWVVSTAPEDVLSCIGLGSCIGLAVVDRTAGVAGLAHVMLPEAPAETPTPGKYADLAVPALLADLEAAGAVRRRMEIVLVGGAQMFKFGNGGGRDIGGRNEQAVREQLDAARLRVLTTATGGDKGRSVKVFVGSGEITCRAAAGETETLLPGTVALAA